MTRGRPGRCAHLSSRRRASRHWPAAAGAQPIAGRTGRSPAEPHPRPPPRGRRERNGTEQKAVYWGQKGKYRKRKRPRERAAPSEVLLDVLLVGFPLLLLDLRDLVFQLHDRPFDLVVLADERHPPGREQRGEKGFQCYVEFNGFQRNRTGSARDEAQGHQIPQRFAQHVRNQQRLEQTR